ncbi:MAG: hypothetical protein NC429_17445 [Lachnospiraceae bacterium]|nr:hypothetical protein [Lachnospiraceae bacterium]
MYKDRPFIVCHILSAVNGKISGDFFHVPETAPISAAYGKIRTEYQCMAALCGAVTAAEIYCCKKAMTDAKKPSQIFPRETWIAEHKESHYNVVVDTEGSLQWENGTICRPNQPDAHAVVILSEFVTDAHLQHLRNVGVSYLFAGKLIDELSIVFCPAVDGQADTASIFDCYHHLTRTAPVAFSLMNVETLPGDGVWLRYKPKNVKKSI